MDAKLPILLVALGAPVMIASAASAETLTVELAKQCRALMVKAYPPLPAGSPRGNAVQEREYFRSCVAQGGKTDNVKPTTDGRSK